MVNTTSNVAHSARCSEGVCYYSAAGRQIINQKDMTQYQAMVAQANAQATQATSSNSTNSNSSSSISTSTTTSSWAYDKKVFPGELNGAF